jgi:cysteine-rich repeat protein
MKSDHVKEMLFLIILTLCACDCGRIDLAGGDAHTDFSQETDQEFDIFFIPDPPERTEFVSEPDPHEPYSDVYPPDAYVPDFWDVEFDYLDIPGDFVPDPEPCGNGVLDPGEECDDGNTNDNDECNNRCLLPRCGDGSVWHAMEDCDPPGTVRPCMTGCDSAGQEWCQAFCRWEGACEPPVETCGNGADDDCDGLVDSIIRLVPAVALSDSPVDGAGANAMAWTGSEFAVVWRGDLARTVLSRLDEWGRKVDWDRDIVIGSERPLGFFWTGSLLGHICYSSGEINGLFLQPLDPHGLPAYPPVFLYSSDSFQGTFAQWSGEAYGILFKNNYPPPTGVFFKSASADGVHVSDAVLEPDYFEMRSFRWIDSEYAMLHFSADAYENRMDFLSPDGALLRTVSIPQPPDMEARIGEVDFTWTGSRFLIAWAENGPLAVSAHERSGAVVSSSTIASNDASSPIIVWTGSEAGLFWISRRDGNHEIYFTRLGADGARLGDDIRLTSTAFDSENPSPVWAASSYGLAWYDSDGIDDDIFFMRFAVCP